MKEIKLSQGQIALVDDEDFEKVNRYRWFVKMAKDRRVAYAIRTLKHNNILTTERMHRLILGLHLHDSRQCDHRDGNGLNNQTENLRFCTNQQNQANSQTICTHNSPFKGVSLCSRGSSQKPWKAQIMVNGKFIYLGIYETAKEAAIAYDMAALKHFGRFALTNKMLRLL